MYDVAPDGRFLMMKVEPPPDAIVRLDWGGRRREPVATGTSTGPRFYWCAHPFPLEGIRRPTPAGTSARTVPSPTSPGTKKTGWRDVPASPEMS